MRALSILVGLILTWCLAGQQDARWIHQLENPEFATYALAKENKAEEYWHYDFSDLLIPRDEFLGFIGSDFQRIHITFHNIRKDQDDPKLYHVSGNSLVKQNKCDFEGTITVEQIREFKNMHYGVDQKYEGQGIQAQGILIGNYEFKEDREQQHAGIFEGIMTLWWYVDRDGNIRYDDIESHSDHYKNNQYVGTWSPYHSGKLKICNWGEKRIPFSGDLDIGAAYFSPNPKYKENGWKNYKPQ